jgi:PPP family 3-phenylpropionic acid transporter
MRVSPTIRFALFASVSNATIAVLMAFWPLWLTSRGLDATEIGVVGAIILWVRVGVTPLVGMLADRSGALYEAVGGRAFFVMAGMSAAGALAALRLSRLATNS